MNISKKALSLIRYNLQGSLKKNGINIWRYVFKGVEKGTGVERLFFIELIVLNPYLSPSDIVLGFDSRVSVSSEQLQNVLAGTVSAQKMMSETFVVPSYICVKAGILGAGARQLCFYAPVKDVKSSLKSFNFEVGRCSFSEERLSGLISQNPSDIQEHPGFLSDTGLISWDLRYEIRLDSTVGFSGKSANWFPVGINTVFAGNISIDGREYSVLPKNSFGYFDRIFGLSCPDNLFHLSSSHLTSVITGKLLEKSSFAVHGVYKDKVSIVAILEDKKIEFAADLSKRAYKSIYDCSTITDSVDGDKLHWTISASNKQYIIDIDVFCIASDLFVRTLELPNGKRKVIKFVSGKSSSGEIRMYKNNRSNLELIEHAHLADCLCEFGSLEVPEE